MNKKRENIVEKIVSNNNNKNNNNNNIFRFNLSRKKFFFSD